MKNKFIKITSLIMLLAIVLGCLVACGGSSVAPDTVGEIGNISWVFKSSDQKLTLT